MAKRRRNKRKGGNITISITGDNVVTTKEKNLMVLKDDGYVFPKLYLGVYIHGPAWEHSAFAALFARAGCYMAEIVEAADLVVFTGGDDVNPALYGKKPHSSTRWDDERDRSDIEMYNLCYEQGIPMFGVCRGAQFLHVMNGGTLIQDISGHQAAHSIIDMATKKSILSSSVHHQMCEKNDKMEVVAQHFSRTTRHYDNVRSETGYQADVEAYFYRDTACLGVQGHPEYRGYAGFGKWVMEKIRDYVNDNIDLIYSPETKMKRLSTEVRDNRKNKEKESV